MALFFFATRRSLLSRNQRVRRQLYGAAQGTEDLQNRTTAEYMMGVFLVTVSVAFGPRMPSVRP